MWGSPTLALILVRQSRRFIKVLLLEEEDLSTK